MYSRIADVFEDRLGEFPTGLPVAAVEEFELEGSEEALGHGVVEGVSDGSHGAEQASLAEPLPERPGGVLGSVVGMVEDLTRIGLASPAGHVQGVDHQSGAQVIGDGPADHPPRPGVDDHSQIHLPFQSGVFGYVGHSKPVGAGWMELAVDQIVGGLSTRIPAGCAMTAATPVYPFDPGLTHQPFHPLAGDGDVLAQSELGPDPW